MRKPEPICVVACSGAKEAWQVEMMVLAAVTPGNVIKLPLVMKRAEVAEAGATGAAATLMEVMTKDVEARNVVERAVVLMEEVTVAPGMGAAATLMEVGAKDVVERAAVLMGVVRPPG